jgi:hypothetical protein
MVWAIQGRFPGGASYFSVLQNVQTGCRAHHLPVVSRPVREADYTHPYNFAFYIFLFFGDSSGIYLVQDGFQCPDVAKTK